MKRHLMKPMFLFSLLLFTLPAVRAAADPPKPMDADNGNPADLDRRIAALEARIQNRPALAEWLDRLSISGVLEAEAGYASVDNDDPAAEDENSSDVTLATLEIGIDAVICDHVTGHVLFLWEEDDTEPVDMDEGFITLSGGESLPLYVRAGKMYVPFGVFESHLISDPLTLELGETRESAVQVGFETNGWHGAIFGFNGDIDEAGEDSHLDNFGGSAGFVFENAAFGMDLNVSYINNLLDSDGWGEDAAERMDAEGLALANYIDGIGASAVLTCGPLTFIGEYITALDDPDFVSAKDDASLVSGEKISAFNAELACCLDVAGKETTAAIAYQGTTHAGDFLPETRIAGVVGAGIFEATTLALEYARETYENDDTEDRVTLQLAVEF